MKGLEVCLLALSAVLFLLSPSMLAQDVPTPVCCPGSPVASGEDNPALGGNNIKLIAQGRFLISESMLQSQGLTRKEFIDRISESLFQGKRIDLIIASRLPIVQPTAATFASLVGSQQQGLVEKDLIAAQQTLFYRVPFYALAFEEINSMDQIGLTDGKVYILVRFVRSASSGVNDPTELR
jgi:hypothetical protein